MQRSLVMLITAWLLAGMLSELRADAAPADKLQTWLAGNAVAVRSVNAADEDFSDLEPLAKAIGPAQVVALGEPGHGAGTAFAAKVRLIKFLHQRMGFDVLIWESGMYDVGLSDAEMRGVDAPDAAARRGIFRLWADAEQVKPLFDYVKASQASLHPLHMAGFDMQVTADGTMERFASDLRAFIGTVQDPGLRNATSELAEQALAARARLFSSNFASPPADLATLNQAVGDLLAAMRDRRTLFRNAHDTRSIALMEHWIENMRIDARNRYQARHSTGPSVELENSRDARNFENLRWLIQEGYPGRKFIIWAHNVHVMKSFYSSDFRSVHITPKADDMKPTGRFLAEWLGRQVYTIGMTTYQGNDALVTGGPATAIAPAPADSLEERLHALGRTFVFLDLRAIPVHAPLAARFPKYESNRVPDAGRVFDGLFYIDNMSAAIRLH